MRRYDDPVEVRKGADEDPDQFLWRGRLWQVREVVAHWVETGAWWARRPAATGTEQANQAGGRGRSTPTSCASARCGGWQQPGEGSLAIQSPEHDPGFGVFDLVFSWSEGSWQLVRAMD